MTKKRFAFLVAISAIFLAAVTHAEWIQDGMSLNVNAGENVLGASMSINSDTPYVTWAEYKGNTSCIYLKYLNGTSWESIGGVLNVDTNRNARTPGIAIRNNIIYLAWYEENRLFTEKNSYVKKYQNGVWEQLGNSLSANKTGLSPKIAVTSSGIPYVVLEEYIGGDPAKIVVKSFSGGNWMQIGGNLNIDTNNFAGGPDIALLNDIPYVIWVEESMAFDTHSYVKHFNGTDWQQDGGDLDTGNVIDTAYPSAIAISDTSPYVSLYICDGIDNNLGVKRFDGNNWVLEGNYVNDYKRQSFGYLSLAIFNNTPYIAYAETVNNVDQIFVKYFNGSNWIKMGESLNVNTTLRGQDTNIAISSLGVPYVAWVEGNSVTSRLYVKHWVPPVTPTATAILANYPDRKLMVFPNPAKNIVHFAWNEPQAEKVRLEIFNVTGERIASLNMTAPGQLMDWNAQSVAPGIYFCRAFLTVDGKEKVLPIQKIAITR